MTKPFMWAAGGAIVALAIWASSHWLRTEPVNSVAAPASGGSRLAVPTPPSPSSAALAVAPKLEPPHQGPTASDKSGDVRAGIGSEGFGPHVQRALDSGDPRKALDAARWIASCRPDMDVESMINGSHPKYRLVLPPEARTAVITKERQNQRFCQTLTPDLMAQHQTLVQRALDAKVPGSGVAYYNSLDRENRSPAELERALKGLRADVEQGEEMAVPLLALQVLGQSRVEQLAYTKLMNLLMLKNILPPTTGLLLPKPPETPYSPDEKAAAAALVTRVWPRFTRPG